MFSVANFEIDSESEEENVSLIRKRIRDHSNPLELPNSRFVSLYRISKDALKYLLDEMSSEFKPLVRSSAIPPLLKICGALRFFADGSYQQSSGQDLMIGMSQSSISESLRDVLNIFEQKICPKWISFEVTEAQKDEAKGFFYRKTGFPGVIGCVDGTHISIIAPTINEHIFFNRKGYHSLNAMIVCDHKMRILSVDARYGGSSHDSLVWGCSDQRLYLQRNRTHGDKNSWLLADSGYPLEPWILTPFRSTTEGSPESRFNMVHSKTRNIVERTIGVLKSRFRCLLGARQLHYAPEKAVQIINACTALHNICIFYNVGPNFIPSETEIGQINLSFSDEVNQEAENVEAQRIRNQIMQCFTN